MWLLSGVMAAVTVLVMIFAWYVAVDLHLMESPRQMPPEVLEHLRRLAAEGKHTEYISIVDEHRSGQFRKADWIYLFSVGAISTIVGGGIGLILARKISRPITAVAAAAAKVAAGEHSVRVDAPNTTGETRALVESFNHMAADLDTYERERRVLTAGIAHELRTPLTVLRGRLHGMIDGVIEPCPGETERLLRQVNQLTRLVDDLRTLAHAEAGELALEQQTIDPCDTLRMVMADLQPTAEAANVRFSHVLEPLKINADAGRMYQVIANLVTNAIKHSPPFGEVRLTVATFAGHARLQVLDQGPGIAAEDRARIFLPFWRARASIDAGHSGSGLGLTLASRLVEAHGGTLSVYNRPGGWGAVFEILLPLADGKNELHRPK